MAEDWNSSSTREISVLNYSFSKCDTNEELYKVPTTFANGYNKAKNTIGIGI